MLEEYEKAEIVNDAYMKKIMQVLGDRKESKKIMSKPNQYILKISDGKNSVNIYQKGKCYCINLDGTNFSSLVAAEGGAYLYKNKKLDIEYKLHEVYLSDCASKRVSLKKIKDYTKSDSYIDNNGNYIFIYDDESGSYDEKITIYNKDLIKLNDFELANFLKIKNNYGIKEYQEEKIDELPKNIEEFDYSRYEKEKELSEKVNFEEPVESDNIESFYDMESFFEKQKDDINEYYENFICMIDDEVVDGDERIQYLQDIYRVMQENDDDFLEISENIDDIITAYESELNKFEPKVQNKSEQNTKIQGETGDELEQ